MHLKNVGFIQRHIEKLLIVVAVASLGGSIWFYLLGTPHKVVIDGVTLPPREIDQELNKRAKTLEAAIASTDVDDDIEQIKDINVVEPYLARLNQKPTSLETMISLNPLPPIPLKSGVDAPNPYHDPTPFPPVLVVQRASLGTIDPAAIAAAPDRWNGILTTSGPTDLSYISITRAFDMGAFRNKKLLRPADDINRAINIAWVKMDNMAIFGFEIRRQDARADGTFAEPNDPDYKDSLKTIGVIPTAKFDATTIPDRLEVSEGANLLKFIKEKDNRLIFIQPDFPKLIDDVWLPAGADAGWLKSGTAATPTSMLAAAPRRGATTPEEERAFLEREFDSRRDGREPAGKTGPIRREIKREAPKPKPVADGKPDPGVTIPINPAPQNDAVFEMWASDLTVTPGATYRYQARVYINNPLFGQKLLKEQEEQGLNRQFLLVSDWTPWAPPITARPLVREYLVAAAQTPAPGQATFDVHRFSRGLWREEKFRLRPGEPIGRPREINAGNGKMMVDFDTGKYLVDLEFGLQVIGPIGNIIKTTQAVLSNGNALELRRLDHDKESLKTLLEQGAGGPAQ